MRIGISFDLRAEVLPAGAPDDFQEEFDAPETITALAEAVRLLGHEPVLLGDGRELIRRVLEQPPDLVLNLAEGHGIARSREARVPAFLEMLGIPYTGSDPLTLAVTLDKDCAKRLVHSAGVRVPAGVLVHPGEDAGEILSRVDLPLPLVAKPAWEGSSKGIRSTCLVQEMASVAAVVAGLHRDHGQPVLLEEFVAGEEVTVGMLGNAPPTVLGLMRVYPRRPNPHFIYSLEVKRDWHNQVDYECPAELPPGVTEAVRHASLAAYRVLGCRDVARLDFRIRDGIPYFLEVNPLPGLNPVSSDLVIMARLLGLDHPTLIRLILEAAWDRLGSSVSATA